MGYKGTAFIISPCLILTTAHNLFAEERLRPALGESYTATFRAGVGSDGFPFEGRVRATSTLWAEGELFGGNDWVIMKMSACIGKREQFGWLLPSYKEAHKRIGQSVVVASFQGDTTIGKLTMSIGRVRSYTPWWGTLSYDASTYPGSSGAPVFATEDGLLKLVGVHVDGFKPDAIKNGEEKGRYKSYRQEVANQFINAREIFTRPEVKRLIDLDIAACKCRNPQNAWASRPVPTRPRATPGS